MKCGKSDSRKMRVIYRRSTIRRCRCSSPCSDLPNPEWRTAIWSSCIGRSRCTGRRGSHGPGSAATRTTGECRGQDDRIADDSASDFTSRHAAKRVQLDYKAEGVAGNRAVDDRRVAKRQDLPSGNSPVLNLQFVNNLHIAHRRFCFCNPCSRQIGHGMTASRGILSGRVGFRPRQNCAWIDRRSPHERKCADQQSFQRYPLGGLMSR